MKKYNKIGLMLGALILAFGLVASAQTTLTASINTPTSGTSYNVGQAISLVGSATGGTGSYTSFVWSFSDGTTSVTGANGQVVTFASAGTKTITLRVTDSDGAKTAVSVNVTVAGNSTKPVISNIKAIDVTTNSVTITWDTNIPASSRVIYDSASHPDISGAEAPNFGYVVSTPETDVETKVTSHSVSITNLSASTKYYFRVISQS